VSESTTKEEKSAPMQCPDLIPVPNSLSIWCDDGDCPHLDAPANVQVTVQNTDGDCPRGGQVLFGWQPLGTSAAATPIAESYIYPPIAAGGSVAVTTVWVPSQAVIGYPTSAAIGWLWATASTDGTVAKNCFCDPYYPTPDPNSPYTTLALAAINAQSCFMAMAAAERAAMAMPAEPSPELVFGFLARHRLGNRLNVKLEVRTMHGAGLADVDASLAIAARHEKTFASGLLGSDDPLIGNGGSWTPQTETPLEPRQTKQGLLRVRFPRREKGISNRGLLEVRLNVAEGRYEGHRIGGFVIGVENDRTRPVWLLPRPTVAIAKDRDEE
jgi:hypothetical protein